MPANISSKRRSCDRCHSQKLKCSRPSQKSNESCMRCLRMRVPCVYSTPLPRGRPSTARPSNATPARDDTSIHSTPKPSDVSSVDQATSSNVTSVMPSPTLGLASTCSSSWTAGDLSQLSGSSTCFWPDGTSDTDLMCDGVIDPISRLSGNACGKEYGERVQSPCEFSPGANLPTPPSGIAALNNQTIFPDAWLPGPDTTEDCIKRLSDLSAELYPVYKASRSFDVTPDKHSHPDFIGSAFGSASIYLDPSSGLSSNKGPTKGDHIQQTFATSHALLDIVRHLANTLPVSPAQSTSQTPRTDESCLNSALSPALPAMPSPLSMAGGPMSAFSALDQDLPAEQLYRRVPPTTMSFETSMPMQDTGTSPNDFVAYHLIIACYTLLLHIFTNLAATLHVHAHRTMQQQKSATLLWPAELRLLLLQRLMAYIIQSLQRVITDYTARLDSKASLSMCSIDRLAHGTDQTFSARLDSVAELQGTVRDKLESLQSVIQA